ncbi:MAG: carboxylating nicotinate-nucleotide diphosphorylase [Myxococcota bacterium]
MIDAAIDRLIDLAIEEDLGRGDATAVIVDADAQARGAILAKQPLVVCGLAIAHRVFARVDARIAMTPHAADGDAAHAGARLADVAGPARAVLGAERTALNFMGRLCGIATLARAYAQAASGTRARVSDTRKTTPGWRALEKYAVRTGGGTNHRMDLAEAILIKDNHLRVVGSISEAVRRARARAPAGMRVEVEVDTLAQLDEALREGATDVLLDNMDDATVAEAVRRAAGRAVVEVSGGVTLERIGRLAAAGVDVISVGRLTHSAPAADLSLELE